LMEPAQQYLQIARCALKARFFSKGSALYLFRAGALIVPALVFC
jgi:hypothetical protein